VKRLLFAVIAAVVAGPALAGDVSASVGIDQPGFYGQINIGDFPGPAVVYAEPVWIERPRRVVYVEPVYLRVPPGHQKHWGKHCGKYGACGRPVYFVREDWYQTYYVPHYQHRDYDDRGVSASIGISQPGFYGQINIGDFPRPAVIYAEPVWIERPRRVVYVEPIYLRVPPGYETHWREHCGKYGACGRPVYFVREDWYQAQYVPHYQHRDHDDRGESHDHDREHGHGKGKGKDKADQND